MCIGTPDIPSVPQRQATKLPDGSAGDRSAMDARRRRGLYASILTSPQGALGNANISGATGSTLG